jgi:hypothetical protein
VVDVELTEANGRAEREAALDAEIYRPMPGLGVVPGDRVLGEFGDAPER